MATSAILPGERFSNDKTKNIIDEFQRDGCYDFGAVLEEDVEEVEYGPTQVVPGSHLSGRYPDEQDQPAFEGRKPHSFLTRRCHAYMFNNQMWRRGAPNASDRTRLMAGVTYSKRFVSRKFHPSLQDSPSPPAADGLEGRQETNVRTAKQAMISCQRS